MATPVGRIAKEFVSTRLNQNGNPNTQIGVEKPPDGQPVCATQSASSKTTNPSGGGARDARRRANIDLRNRCRLPLHQSRPLRPAVQRSVRAVPIGAPAGPRSPHGLIGKAAPQLTTTEPP